MLIRILGILFLLFAFSYIVLNVLVYTKYFTGEGVLKIVKHIGILLVAFTLGFLGLLGLSIIDILI